MTRLNQKQKEYEILRALLRATGIRPECLPLKAEKPDFTMLISGRTVGIEVTMYQSGKTVAGVGRRAVKRRVVESEWERLEKSSKNFQREHADLKNVYILFRFKNIVPPKKEHDAFFQEILQFVRSRQNAVSAEGAAFWMPDFQSPLMKKYLKDMTLRRCECGEWDSSITAGFVGRPACTISKIVATKTNSAEAYLKADELWLVVGQSGLLSEMVLPINGASELDKCLDLQEGLLSSPFSRVYVFTAMGLFQWDKSEGNWQLNAWHQNPALN
jgi:hypothetical protein